MYAYDLIPGGGMEEGVRFELMATLVATSRFERAPMPYGVTFRDGGGPGVERWISGL